MPAGRSCLAPRLPTAPAAAAASAPRAETLAEGRATVRAAEWEGREERSSRGCELTGGAAFLHGTRVSSQGG